MSTHFLSPKDGEPQKVRWRLAGKEWSAWSESSDFRIEGLSPGPVTTEIQGLNAYLETSPMVAKTFDVRYDIETTLKHALADLRSEDWNLREEAVRTLARFPEEAFRHIADIPTQNLSPADTWWLEAARQAVAREKQARKNQTHP